MQIKIIKTGKEKFMDLLLLGDEQESMVCKYLDRGELFALFDDDLKTVCVVTREDEKIYEIKNIATYQKDQRKGYGSFILKYIIKYYENQCDTLFIGTGDDDQIISYYKKFGFVYSHTVKDFFVDHYDHAMFENGKQLRDMIYLQANMSRL